MNLHEIVKTWLTDHGYDGLYNEDECGCSLDDFIPCAQPGEHCIPGYKKLTPDGDSDFIICPEKQANRPLWYALYWTRVSHLIKPSRRFPDVSRSLCGIMTAATTVWTRTDGIENPPRRCVTCTRIAKGLEGK